MAIVLLYQGISEVTEMNFYYSLNDRESKPEFLGNFDSFHLAEAEIRKWLNGSSGKFSEGYLFLHKSALPWQNLERTYFGSFRLVRIISTPPLRRIGTVNLIAENKFGESLGQIGWLPKAS